MIFENFLPKSMVRGCTTVLPVIFLMLLHTVGVWQPEAQIRKTTPGYFANSLFYLHSGVEPENFCKGRIFGDFVDIWKIFLEILPLQNSGKKPRKNTENTRKT